MLKNYLITSLTSCENLRLIKEGVSNPDLALLFIPLCGPAFYFRLICLHPAGCWRAVGPKVRSAILHLHLMVQVTNKQPLGCVNSSCWLLLAVHATFLSVCQRNSWCHARWDLKLPARLPPSSLLCPLILLPLLKSWAPSRPPSLVAVEMSGLLDFNDCEQISCGARRFLWSYLRNTVRAQLVVRAQCLVLRICIQKDYHLQGRAHACAWTNWVPYSHKSCAPFRQKFTGMLML